MATTKTNSKTSSSGGSNSKTTSNSSTNTSSQGGSNSYSTGGSSSSTTSNSTTYYSADTVGGSHSETAGKSWASGKVDDETMAKRQDYNRDYAEGLKVAEAYDNLQATIDNKPTFQSKYESNLNDLYNKVMNREKFNYDFNADEMYKMYKDKYAQQGKNAMKDTIGQATALTGGYNSSYAQSVGQQQYQNYLQQLNDIIPTLRDAKYKQYQDEGAQLLNQYNVASDAYNREYGQYRNDVSDWQADRNFNYQNYSDERNFDYSKFNNDRSYWNDEYWKERNAEQSNASTTDSSNWSHTSSVSSTVGVSNTNGINWNNVVSTNWQNQLSNTAAQSQTAANTWNNSSTSSTSTGTGSGSSSSGNTSSLLNSGTTSNATTDGKKINQIPFSNSSFAQDSNLSNFSSSDIDQARESLANAKTNAGRKRIEDALIADGMTKLDIQMILDDINGKRKLYLNDDYNKLLAGDYSYNGLFN